MKEGNCQRPEVAKSYIASFQLPDAKSKASYVFTEFAVACNVDDVWYWTSILS
jgi:hypothetical protein